MALYCIDTSSILEAWVRHYPPDIFGSIWSRIDELIEGEDLIAPEEVHQELRHPRELSEWAKGRAPMFRELDGQEHQRTVTSVVDRLRAELRNRNLQLRPTDFKADPFVVALARVEEAAVICDEKRQTDPQGRPKVPNLCDWYEVRSINFVSFLREIGWTT